MSRIALEAFSRKEGSIITEIVIVLPVLLLMVFGGIEYSRYLRAYDQLHLLARAAGTNTSRECTTAQIYAAYDGAPSDPVPLIDCIEHNVENFWWESRALRPQIRLIATLYRNSGGVTQLVVQRAFGPVNQGGAFYNASQGAWASKIDLNQVTADFNVINQTGDLVVIEAYSYFEGMIPIISNFFGGTNGRNLYVSAIF